MSDEKKIQGHTGKLSAEVLSAHGIDSIFTLSGGHIFPLFDGCMDKKIRLVDVRHEQTAVFAAEASAKVTRQVGVAALTAGPGVTNGVSAMTSAYFSGSPVCVIGGRAPQAQCRGLCVISLYYRHACSRALVLRFWRRRLCSGHRLRFSLSQRCCLCDWRRLHK